MSWQIAAWLLLGGSTILLFMGLPVAFSFLVINLVGALILASVAVYLLYLPIFALGASA